MIANTKVSVTGVTAVFHPAALLRDPRRKPETLEDFKSIREKAEELGLL